MTEPFQATNQSASGVFRAKPVKVIATQFVVNDGLGQQANAITAMR